MINTKKNRDKKLRPPHIIGENDAVSFRETDCVAGGYGIKCAGISCDERFSSRGEIWVSGSIAQGGARLGLRGGSLKADLVPQYLQRLGKEPSFAGTEFKTFLLTREKAEAKWVAFELNTEATDEVRP